MQEQGPRSRGLCPQKRRGTCWFIQLSVQFLVSAQVAISVSWDQADVGLCARCRLCLRLSLPLPTHKSGAQETQHTQQGGGCHATTEAEGHSAADACRGTL